MTHLSDAVLCECGWITDGGDRCGRCGLKGVLRLQSILDRMPPIEPPVITGIERQAFGLSNKEDNRRDRLHR